MLRLPKLRIGMKLGLMSGLCVVAVAMMAAAQVMSDARIASAIKSGSLDRAASEMAQIAIVSEILAGVAIVMLLASAAFGVFGIARPLSKMAHVLSELTNDGRGPIRRA